MEQNLGTDLESGILGSCTVSPSQILRARWEVSFLGFPARPHNTAALDLCQVVCVHFEYLFIICLVMVIPSSALCSVLSDGSRW